MSFTVIVPARLASTRLPNKPLADIGGLPMVARVARQAMKSSAAKVVVAADSQSIVDACTEHDVPALLTAVDHPSGSDRLAEACTLLGLADDEIVVNVQGDEPLIDPALIDAVAMLLKDAPHASMSTAAHEITSEEDFANANVVKVVTDKSGLALYFSRSPIPFKRDGAQGALPSPGPLRHVGIYGYRVGFLKAFPTMAVSPIETIESLEQLRAMWHGYRIVVHTTQHAPGPGVDTPQDLERVRQLISTLAQ